MDEILGTTKLKGTLADAFLQKDTSGERPKPNHSCRSHCRHGCSWTSTRRHWTWSSGRTWSRHRHRVFCFRPSGPRISLRRYCTEDLDSVFYATIRKSFVLNGNKQYLPTYDTLPWALAQEIPIVFLEEERVQRQLSVDESYTSLYSSRVYGKSMKSRTNFEKSKNPKHNPLRGEKNENLRFSNFPSKTQKRRCA